MARRPILFTLLFWLLVGLAHSGLVLRCGLGAGWDIESNNAITDCRYVSQMWAGWVTFVAIIVYAAWAVVTIRRLAPTDNA